MNALNNKSYIAGRFMNGNASCYTIPNLIKNSIAFHGILKNNYLSTTIDYLTHYVLQSTVEIKTK